MGFYEEYKWFVIRAFFKTHKTVFDDILFIEKF